MHDILRCGVDALCRIAVTAGVPIVVFRPGRRAIDHPPNNRYGEGVTMLPLHER